MLLRPLLLVTLLLALQACSPISPPPQDMQPLTPIVEFPTPSSPPTATLEPRLLPIMPADLEVARTFFLMLQVSVTAGDSGFIAAHVRYPITTNIDGRPTLIDSAEMFERAYAGIFDIRLQKIILESRADALVLMGDGVHAAGGALVFNLYSIDPACAQSQFLVTQIFN